MLTPTGLALALVSGVASAYLTQAPTEIVATVAVGQAPSAIAVDEQDGHVFVANSADNTISMLDAQSGQVLRLIPVGSGPDQVQINPRTRRVFVMNENDHSVTVLDAMSGAVRQTLTRDTAPPTETQCRTNDAFVFDHPDSAAIGTNSVPGFGQVRSLLGVLDGPGGTWLSSIPVPPHGWQLAADGQSGQIFVPLAMQNSVSIINDVCAQSLSRTVSVGSQPVAITLDTRTERAFVVNSGLPVMPFDPPGSMSVLDSRTGQLVRTVALGRDPALVAVDATAGRVLVVHGWSGATSLAGSSIKRGTDILDARSGTLLTTLAAGTVAPQVQWLPAHPQLLAVDQQRGEAFVMDAASGAIPGDPLAGRVTVLDDRLGQIVHNVSAGAYPVGLAVDATADRLFVLDNNADCHTRHTAWSVMPPSVRFWLPFLPPGSSSQGEASLTCAAHGSVIVYDLARL